MSETAANGRRVRKPKETYHTLDANNRVLVLPLSKDKREIFGDVLMFGSSGACQAMISAHSPTGESVTLLDGEYLLARPHSETVFESDMDSPRSKGPKPTNLYLNQPRSSVLNHILANSRYYGLESLLRDQPKWNARMSSRYKTQEEAEKITATGRDVLKNFFYLADNQLVRLEDLPADVDFILSVLAWVKRAQMMFLRAANWHLMQAPGSPVVHAATAVSLVPKALWVSARLPAVVPHLDFSHPESYLNIVRRPSYGDSRRVSLPLVSEEGTTLSELLAYALTFGTSRRSTSTAALDAASSAARYIVSSHAGVVRSGHDYYAEHIHNHALSACGYPHPRKAAQILESHFSRVFAKETGLEEYSSTVRVRVAREIRRVSASAACLAGMTNLTNGVVTFGTKENGTTTRLFSQGAATLSKWYSQG